ncbi:MAG: hypothetical protein ACREFB_14050 [Stellaceae bacterium]
MNLRRGTQRLVITLVALWNVYWTFTYTLVSPASEATPPPPSLSLSTACVLLAAVILAAPWVIAGFRAN